MALGTYGTVRPADMSPEDVEIILNYTPSRDVTTNFVLTKLKCRYSNKSFGTKNIKS